MGVWGCGGVGMWVRVGGVVLWRSDDQTESRLGDLVGKEVGSEDGGGEEFVHTVGHANPLLLIEIPLHHTYQSVPPYQTSTTMITPPATTIRKGET